MSPGPPFAELLAAQDVLLLERRRPGDFQPVGFRPAWTEGWTTEELAHPTHPFPFLTVFLPEATAFWDGHRPGPCRGGPWTQPATRPETPPLELEVSAWRFAQRDFLLLRRLSWDHEERQELLQKARELTLAHERLAAAIEKKEVLLHCIIHDLNGPLSAMLGCLELLKREALTPAAQEIIAIGLAEATRQSHRIQEVLDCFAADVAQLDATAGATAGVDLLDTSRRLLHHLTPAFQARSVSLHFLPPPETPGPWQVAAEPSRLERVLYNLLENALRHCPRAGTVALSLTRHDGRIETSVIDSGPGIDPDTAQGLFQKFGRGRGGGRAGLGLYFCRITIERWGGTIGCETLASGGTRFWFRLPAVT